ncbi:MAG TPA: hypothetical protein VED41_04350 [Solirubrobacteraceae bacterium]|nr:hypothetical protein [Solirubrobacteraceae bacterium]
MEDGWPSSVGFREQALNDPVLRWLKTVVVSATHPPVGSSRTRPPT